MQAFTITDSPEKLTLTIDKERFGEEDLYEAIELLRLQVRIKSLDVDEEILDLAKEIKAKWWAEQREAILKRIGR